MLTGYKLMRKRKDGTYGPLFINRKMKLVPGVEYPMEDHPTKGFARRPGWHICPTPEGAPHIKKTSDRVWVKVRFTPHHVVERPAHQGGVWFLGSTMEIIEEV